MCGRRFSRLHGKLKASAQNASHIFEGVVSRFDEDFPVAADVRDAEFEISRLCGSGHFAGAAQF